MSIITISRGTFSGGKEFAENLARKLGYRSISREQLSEEAIKMGVPVGRLQTAMVKPPRVAKRLGPEREFYLSCMTSLLCAYTLEGNIVYHGHTGHLLLSGVPNIFRVRVIGDMEARIKSVTERLNINREKALEYIRSVDADRDKWVKFLYGVNWDDPLHYDIVVNLSQMGAANSTTALCAMAELPDFTLTPSDIRALKNLRLSSMARFRLAKDKRTGFADFKVRADNGIVQVTCMPHQAEVAQYVREVLEGMEDCKEVQCTIAGSNILWIGEQFDANSELYRDMIKIAKRWDAAVEIMKYAVEIDRENDTAPAAQEVKKVYVDRENGGIEDDVEEDVKPDTDGIAGTLDELIKEGCSGGRTTVYGDKETLITTLGHRTDYSLVVLGNIFMSKPEPVRKRQTAELRSLLSDNIKAPVVGAEELKQELKTGLKDILRLALLISIAFILFMAVFLNQEFILSFMASAEFKSYRIIVIIGLLLFVPAFAYTYGSSARQILKFFKLD